MAPAETSREHKTPSFPKPSGEYWIEALENGVHVLIRPLQAQDREREKAFIERLSPESGFTTVADPDDASQVIHRLSLI